MSSVQTPVIFCVFNRPELTAQVFARIRAVRPQTLYVICDGPRLDHSEDAERVAAVRSLIENGVDWPCKLIKDFAETNLGCGPRLASGLSAGFERLGEAIVLEDDCLPHASFFDYCGWLLKHYRGDKEVMHINGTNLAAARLQGAPSYRFSHHVWVWGWASWQRAWTSYDYTMKEWPDQRAAAAATFASTWEAQYWTSTYDRTHRDIAGANTWDFQWAATCRAQRGLTLLPARNLVTNIGFHPSATHTTSGLEHLDLEYHPAAVARHPNVRFVNAYLDELFTRRYADAPRGIRANFFSHLRCLKRKFRSPNSI